jgi:hypothetical protein
MTSGAVVRRTLALALVVGIVAVGLGAVVAKATFPSSEELQRESLEALGLPPDLVDSPLVQLVLDQFGGRVEDHVVDEARRSAFLGGAAGAAVVVAGFALVLADARRRNRSAPGAEPVAAAAPAAPAAPASPVPPVPPPPGPPATP